MNSTGAKILVKVGNSSRLKFREAKSFRAITLTELERLYKLNPDASITIIENIKQSDGDRIKRFIKDFEKSEGHKIFFYVPDNDENTCGIADELAYDIYLTDKDLYRAIKLHCNVSVDIDLSIKGNSINSDSDFDSSFGTDLDGGSGDALETISIAQQQQDIQEARELPSIQTKDDIDDFDTSILDETEVVEDKKDVYEEQNKVEHNTGTNNAPVINTAIQEELKKADNKIDDLTSQLHSAIEKNRTLTKLVKSIEDERDIFKTKLEQIGTNEVLEEPISLVEYQELQTALEKLREQSQSNSISQVDLTEIQEKCTELEEYNKELTHQLEEYKDRLRESGTKLNDAMTKITSYQVQLTNLNKKTAELEARSGLNAEQTSEIEELTIRLSIELANIEELNSKISENSDEIIKLNSEIIKLTDEKSKLESRATKEAESRIMISRLLFVAVNKLFTTRDELNSKDSELEVLKMSLSELENIKKANLAAINSYEERLLAFSEADSNLKILEDKLKLSEGEKAEANQRLQQLQTELAEKESKLQEVTLQAANTDKRVELAHNYAKEQIDQIKRETDSWRVKYESVQYQYDELVKTCGVDEIGAEALAASTKALEEVNKNLRGQLNDLKNTVSKAISDRDIALRKAKSLEDANKSLQDTMSTLSSGLGTGVSVSSIIPPLKYKERGNIIPVFGSGSFGITTTAMSIAAKLSSQYHVLYIDFDIVNPKADSWFKINPVVKNLPELNGQGITGLETVVEKSAQFFIKNSNLIISHPITTKSGCVDYISGFYTRPNRKKLMTTDFSSFLNYCGTAYTYIIVDFGRLGCSELNDNIIKAFSDVAFKNVVVSTSDKFEIRTLRSKITASSIDINKIAWLVNMCERTSIEDTAKKFIKPAPYSLIPFNAELYGKRLDFTKQSLTRDKLSLFMDKVLFPS